MQNQNPVMSLLFISANTVHRCRLLFPLLIVCLLFNPPIAVEAQDNKDVTNVGAVIDVNSRIGKEQKTAMEIAAESFNSQSKSHELKLHFRNSGRDPLLAASAARELIKEQKVQVLIGMETWQEAVTVADVVQNISDQVAVISFASPTIEPPLIQRRWPFLIRMASDGAAQMKCIGDVVSAYNWKWVVVIYEDDGYGGDMGMLALLSETLRTVGSRIEYRLVLPRLSSNPNWDELEELFKLPTIKSRAFIVLQSSLPTATHLFKVAKKMGLIEADSAWIITESITNLLEPRGNYDMEGILGVKSYYTNDTSYFNFQKELQEKFPEEDNPGPGIYALRAYDVIAITSQVISRMPGNTTSTSLQESLAAIVSNYKGLSGKMLFEGGKVLLDSPRLPSFRIMNVVNGKTNKELNFWTPVSGFSDSPGQDANRSSDVGKVIWPGNLTRASKGWVMPTNEKRMKIALPVIHNDSFIRRNPSEKKYEGFSIELFYRVREMLDYPLPYELIEFNGSKYNDLIEEVYNKTYDAVVGDITILAERTDKVEFTQPYVESGLTMIIPDESDESSAWLFMKPFTWQMWVATGGILIYTMLIVWFLEGPSNPEFDGPLKQQIATASWFTFSSLFFAHREKVFSNLTRVVFVVWLFVVLVLNSSYTANLSSMLTIQRLNPNVTDIEMLRSANSLIGCDADSFIQNYLVNVLNFKKENLREIESNFDPVDFKNKNLSAVFLELPYAEAFTNKYCEGYTLTQHTNRFGGFGFVFQKGSPIAKDFSKHFLDLLQNGTMKELQNKWLTPNLCPNNATSDVPETLSITSFWVLFVISGVTSTFCFLLSLTICLKKFKHEEASRSNV